MNHIHHRVADFLSKYPPFDFLEESELLDLSAKVDIQFFKEGSKVFSKDEPAHNFLYVVHQGAVQLYTQIEGSDLLADSCDEGDMFGVRAMLSGKKYSLTAICAEDCLLYLIPIAYFKRLMEQRSQIAEFFAQGLAGGQVVLRKEDKNSTFFSPKISPLEEAQIFRLMPSAQLISCNSKSTIQQAAEQMTLQNVGSMVVVDESKKPVGILTDTDLRKQVATGKVGINKTVNSIMHTPVICMRNGLPLVEYLALMITKNISHIVITKDGSAQSGAISVISERDLVSKQQQSPISLIKSIRKAENAEELAILRDKADELLALYLEQELAISYLSSIITAINDALISRLIYLNIAFLEKKKRPVPDVRFAWVSLGSEGRGEQLLRTDQDSALIFEDVEAAQFSFVQSYFLDLAKLVTEDLERCGFALCPAQMMASNPQWCMSLSQWKKQFAKWMSNPDLQSVMHCTIFFDFRLIIGNGQLTEELEQFIMDSSKKENLFIHFLAKNATQNPPPLSFFRNFLVEKSGQHKDEFDIKLRAMMPLVDAARLLCLHHGVKNQRNTVARFQSVSKMEKHEHALMQEAALAYEILMKYRAMQGLANKNSGRFIDIKSLKKIERQHIRNAFEPISKLQEILELRFKLSHFG